MGVDSKGRLVSVGSGYARPDGAPDSPLMVAAQVTMKHRGNGSADWLCQYTPLASEQTWVTIDSFAFDQDDSLFTAGTLYSVAPTGGPDEDFLVQKIDPKGCRVWADRYDGGNSLDVVAGVVPDGQGGAFVTGTSHMQAGDVIRRGITTIHYDAEGRRTWVMRHSDPENHEQAVNIVSDRFGGVYVTATSCEDRRAMPMALHYDGEGNLLWEARPERQGLLAAVFPSWAVTAAVDKQGNLLMCANGLDSPNSFTSFKYAPDGQLLWRLEESVPKDRLMAFRAVIDSRGNLVVGSTVYNGRSAYAVTVIAPNGKKRWTSFVEARKKEMLVGSDVGTDSAGNVYLTGLSIGDDGVAHSQATVKLSAAGSQLWRFDYGGSRKAMADLPSLAISPGQKVAVTGVTSWWTSEGGRPVQVREPVTYQMR